MTMICPVGGSAPAVVAPGPLAVPAGFPVRAGQLVECGRWEWWTENLGEPAAALETFLADHGLPVRDLTAPARQPDRRGPSAAGSPGAVAGAGSPGAVAGAGSPGAVAGAVVLLSAGAAARMVGAPARPTPVPAVPDAVAIVYRYADQPDRAPAAAAGSGLAEGPPWRLGRWRESWSAGRHGHAIGAVREAIARGDAYQVNVVGHASAAYQGDPLPALRRVAGLPGARYGWVLTGQGWAVGCASPETLLEVSGGVAVTRPIKGTRPATPAGRAELLASAKERAEHVMIVDLMRNDLARVARTGTVAVDELYGIRRWCRLWQAESTVSARLTGGVGLAEVLRALCPGGSVTGAPKLAALDLIAALEPVGRGPSMGAVGWIGPGRIDLGLTIRTVAADAERLHVWAGGGITWDSDPAAEVAEAAAKAGPLRQALAGA